MGDLFTDPWEGELRIRNAHPPEVTEEGDELETRQAWLEQLADRLIVRFVRLIWKQINLQESPVSNVDQISVILSGPEPNGSQDLRS